MKPKDRFDELSQHFTKRSNYWEEIYTKRKAPPNFMIYELSSRMENTLNFIDNLFNGKPLKILDVGCGTGHYIEQLIPKNHIVFGNDIAIGMLHKSKQKYLNFIDSHFLSLSNIEQLPFRNKSFDVVICIGVIEYLPDVNQAIEELHRIVRDDGIVIISAPNQLSLKFLTDPYYLKRLFQYVLIKSGLRRNEQRSTNPDVSANIDFKNKRFRLGKLKKIFNSNGFSIIEFKSISFGPISFFLKPILPLQLNIQISNCFEKLSNEKGLTFIKRFANRWVFELKKSEAL